MAAVLLYVMAKTPVAVVSRPGLKTDPAAGRNFTKEAQEALRRFDTDKNGKLSRQEIEQIPAAKNRDIDALIRRFDRDGDGQLNLDELAEAIRTLTTEAAGKEPKSK